MEKREGKHYTPLRELAEGGCEVSKVYHVVFSCINKLKFI
jgi:hypothetical protein